MVRGIVGTVLSETQAALHACSTARACCRSCSNTIMRPPFATMGSQLGRNRADIILHAAAWFHITSVLRVSSICDHVSVSSSFMQDKHTMSRVRLSAALDFARLPGVAEAHITK